MKALATDVLVVIGRPTFDLASAEPIVADAIAVSDPTTVIAGGGCILRSPEEVADAMVSCPVRAHNLVILFASFADSRLAGAVVNHFEHVDDIVLWSLPEEWVGGRLRRNSLCGANLAAFRLTSDGYTVASLHEHPHAASQRSIEQATLGSRRRCRSNLSNAELDLRDADRSLVAAAVSDVRASSIGVVGDAPPGFEPCTADAAMLPGGASVSHEGLGRLFEEARHPLSSADRAQVSTLVDLPSTTSIAPDGYERTVALQSGAERLAVQGDWNALAIRCWPECFDEWGGAACASMAMLNEHGLPAACEADIFGALTMRMMQRLSGKPTFLADLVDADLDRDQLAFWHCGVAPPSFAADGSVAVAVHPNRQIPAVFDFGLVDGPVTMARLSQSGGQLRLVVGQGRIIGGQPFTGTSGIVQLATSARTLLGTVFEEGLEHHFVLAAGHLEHLAEAVAAELNLPVIHVT